MLRISFAFLILIVLTSTFDSMAQLPYPLPAAQDTVQFGRYLQRTMKLLATSTPSKKNTVKILVYGQSIAKQEWSDTVRKYLKKRFPHANIVMINRSIGGCWAGCLQDPMEYDIKTFYPDLILFDVYGWNAFGGSQGPQYEGIIRFMREHTTAEIGMQNHHVTSGDIGGGNDNSDFVRMANLYKVELIDIRTPWLKYLVDNSITNADDLTSDGTHLNDRGKFLMARLWLPYLQYKPQFASDPETLMTTFKVGVDVHFVNGKLILPFQGTKIDLVTGVSVANGDSAHIFIDGLRPSVIPGTVMFTRPNEPYDTIFSHFGQFDWPWQKGGIMKFVSPNQNLVPENWNLQISNFNASSNFRFTATGSKTGSDGTGQANISGSSASGNRFTSNSGLVSFDPNKFWFDKGPYSNAYTLGNGFQITWEAKSFYTDTFVAPVSVTSINIDQVVTLAQGLTNSKHVLSIIGFGSTNMPIQEIRVYRPFYNRSKLNVTTTEVVKICAEETVDITANFVDNTALIGSVDVFADRNSKQRLTNLSASTFTGIVYLVKTVSSNNFRSTSSFVIKQGPICTPNLVVNVPTDSICVEKATNLTRFFADVNSVTGTINYWTDVDASIPFEGDVFNTTPDQTVYIKKVNATDPQYFDLKVLSFLTKLCKPSLNISKIDTVCASVGYDFSQKSVVDLNRTSINPNLLFATDTANANSSIDASSVQKMPGNYYAKIISDSAITTYKLAVVIKSCSVTGVDPIILPSQLSLYPNPTDGLLQISWNKELKPIAISILNGLGQEVLSFTKLDSHSISINLSGLPKGMCMAKVSSAQGVYLMRFVLQ